MTYDEWQYWGAHFIVRNGAGTTDSTNGVGNLIVGYDEIYPSSVRGASHNVGAGMYNSSTSLGGPISTAHVV